MNNSESRIDLYPGLFTENEKPFLHAGPLAASVFQYSTGVCAVRLRNELGALILLPFQGQQIWSAEFGQRNLTMRSVFAEPRPNQTYLGTYGAFFLHCGFTAMGAPGKNDTHPLHGELPNAVYPHAHLVVGSDSRGSYIGLGGKYQHTAALNYNYLAEPLVKLYAGSALFNVAMQVTNLRGVELEYMYMAHINFRPVDNGRLVYTAPCTPETVRVRTDIPTHIKVPAGYREFVEDMARNPAKHNVLQPGMPFNPELVLMLAYIADEAGWAHSMQILPDGAADYVAHRPDQLDKVVRWIARPDDHDALGLALPATAGPEGYTAEKSQGNVKVLAAHGEWRADIEIGALSSVEARLTEGKIGKILAKA